MDSTATDALERIASALEVIAYECSNTWAPKRIGVNGTPEHFNPLTGERLSVA